MPQMVRCIQEIRRAFAGLFYSVLPYLSMCITAKCTPWHTYDAVFVVSAAKSPKKKNVKAHYAIDRSADALHRTLRERAHS